MPYTLVYGTVRDTARSVIHVVRVRGAILEPPETDDIIARLCEKLQSRGEQIPEIVAVQGDSKETLSLTGSPYAIARVRAAMFNAALHWSPLQLD